MNAVETLKLIGRPNAYYPSLAKPLGGVNAAVLFSQLFYWQDKASSDLGVYKTRDELEDETGLTHNEQRTAIKKLSDKGILIITEKRLDHKTFYKINNEKVNEILANFAKSMNQSSPNRESNHPEVDNVDVGETTKSSSLDQDITTKITTENTTNIVSADKSQKKQNPTQFRDSFTPNDHHYEIALELNINVSEEFIKFKDYCLANGKKYVDWNAGFNNWLRNSVKFKSSGRKNNNQFMTRSERNLEVMRSL